MKLIYMANGLGKKKGLSQEDTIKLRQRLEGIEVEPDNPLVQSQDQGIGSRPVGQEIEPLVESTDITTPQSPTGLGSPITSIGRGALRKAPLVALGVRGFTEAQKRFPETFRAVETELYKPLDLGLGRDEYPSGFEGGLSWAENLFGQAIKSGKDLLGIEDDPVQEETTYQGKTLTDIFRSDIPRESWLAEKVDYAKSKGKDPYGNNHIGVVTGSFSSDVPITMPVSELIKLKGGMGEQENIRQKDLDWLIDHMGRTGKLPTYGEGKEDIPFITVDYEGIPIINEGNHRIMAADALGMKELPVEIRYFDGGERNAKGLFKPENIFNKLIKDDPVEEGIIPQSKDVDIGQNVPVKKIAEEGIIPQSKYRYRVYHGTLGDWKGTKFRPSKDGAFGSGIYFTPDTKYASDYTSGEGGRVIPAYLDLRKPLIVGKKYVDPSVEALVKLGVKEDKAYTIVEKSQEEYGGLRGEIATLARKQGYDSIIYVPSDKPNENISNAHEIVVLTNRGQPLAKIINAFDVEQKNFQSGGLNMARTKEAVYDDTEDQMDMMGFEPQEQSIDTVSGNEVPLGGTAEGVRDDIDVKMSKGEMVIPEYAVNYHGVETYVDSIQKAQRGYDQMKDMGLVGNPDEAIMDQSEPLPKMGAKDIPEYQFGGLSSAPLPKIPTPTIAQPVTEEVSTVAPLPPVNTQPTPIMSPYPSGYFIEIAGQPNMFKFVAPPGQQNTLTGTYTREQIGSSAPIAPTGTKSESVYGPGFQTYTPSYTMQNIPSTGGYKVIPYTNAEGNIIYMTSVNGQIQGTVPAGYSPSVKEAEPQMEQPIQAPVITPPISPGGPPGGPPSPPSGVVGVTPVTSPSVTPATATGTGASFQPAPVGPALSAENQATVQSIQNSIQSQGILGGDVVSESSIISQTAPEASIDISLVDSPVGDITVVDAAKAVISALTGSSLAAEVVVGVPMALAFHQNQRATAQMQSQLGIIGAAASPTGWSYHKTNTKLGPALVAYNKNDVTALVNPMQNIRSVEAMHFRSDFTDMTNTDIINAMVEDPNGNLVGFNAPHGKSTKHGMYLDDGSFQSRYGISATGYAGDFKSMSDLDQAEVSFRRSRTFLSFLTNIDDSFKTENAKAIEQQMNDSLADIEKNNPDLTKTQHEDLATFLARARRNAAIAPSVAGQIGKSGMSTVHGMATSQAAAGLAQAQAAAQAQAVTQANVDAMNAAMTGTAAVSPGSVTGPGVTGAPQGVAIGRGTPSGPSGPGGKIICLESHRQGLLDTKIFEADETWGDIIPKIVLDGYHLWAKPVVRKMRKSRSFSKKIAWLSRPVAKEAAKQMGVGEGSKIGLAMLCAGMPICAVLGAFMLPFKQTDIPLIIDLEKVGDR